MGNTIIPYPRILLPEREKKAEDGVNLYPTSTISNHINGMPRITFSTTFLICFLLTTDVPQMFLLFYPVHGNRKP